MKFSWSELATDLLDRFAVIWILFCLHAVCGYTKEGIYCILDIVHILKWTVQLCKLSEYFRSQDTDICVLVDFRWITGQITGQVAGYSG